MFKGDSVGVQVSENGDAHYYVNGQNKGVVFQHLPQHQDLWGVVYLNLVQKTSQNFILVSACSMLATNLTLLDRLLRTVYSNYV